MSMDPFNKSPGSRATAYLLAGCLCLGTLGGCAATQVAITKRNLEVQTNMSASIFLDPVKPSDRTVYLQVRNTSDRQDMNIGTELSKALAKRGYQVVEDSDHAHYLLQANVLYVGKTPPGAQQLALHGGYGSPIGGALLGLTVAGAAGSTSGRGLAAGALAGGLLETVSGALVQDVTFTAVTDIQIKELLPSGQRADAQSTGSVTNGSSTTERVLYTSLTDRRIFQTRVVSTANQVNLSIDAATQPLRESLANSVAGIF